MTSPLQVKIMHCVWIVEKADYVLHVINQCKSIITLDGNGNTATENLINPSKGWYG